MPAVAALLGRNGAGAKASEAHAEPGFLLVPHPYRTRKCVKRNSGWGVWGERLRSPHARRGCTPGPERSRSEAEAE